MYIIGGTTTQDLFSKENSLNDIYYLDLNTLNWTQIMMNGDIPSYLAYNYISNLDDNNILVFWCDRTNDNYEINVSKFIISENEWKMLE